MTDTKKPEDPREVLTDAELQAVREFFSYGATRGNHAEHNASLPGPLTPHIAAMGEAIRKLTPPATPKPEPVWREGNDGSEWAIAGGKLMWRYPGGGQFPAGDLTPDLICQLAADYYRLQGPMVLDEAVKAATQAWYEATSDAMRHALRAAAPHILAANGHAKPKAVRWVIVDKHNSPVMTLYLTRESALADVSKADALFQDTAPHRVLALVEPSEVQP